MVDKRSRKSQRRRDKRRKQARAAQRRVPKADLRPGSALETALRQLGSERFYTCALPLDTHCNRQGCTHEAHVVALTLCDPPSWHHRFACAQHRKELRNLMRSDPPPRAAMS